MAAWNIYCRNPVNEASPWFLPCCGEEIVVNCDVREMYCSSLPIVGDDVDGTVSDALVIAKHQVMNDIATCWMFSDAMVHGDRDCRSE